MRDYKRLKLYPKAHALVLFVYDATQSFPRREWYGLVAQMRACAVSISANVVEGCGRDTAADFAHFLDISTGSANELRYYAELSRDLGYLPADVAEALHARATEVIRMLVALARAVRPLRPRTRPRKSSPKPALPAKTSRSPHKPG